MKFLIYLNCFLAAAVAVPMQKQIYRPESSAGCISKYYNKDLGPLEILMMPLGEKLWLRAWLGMHMSNLLHMETVDLSDVMESNDDRKKRSITQMIDTESENKYKKTHDDNIIPYSYRLKVQPYIDIALFRAELQINFTCISPTNSLILHINNQLKVNDLKIRRLDFSNSTQQYESDEEWVTKVFLETSKIIRFEKMSLLEVLLPENIVKDAHYEIYLKYEGPMSTGREGMFFHSYQDGSSMDSSWYAGTNLKRGSVQNVFPCFCGSKYKATFQLSIAHPSDMTAVSSSSLLETENVSSIPGWEWSHFKTTPPMILSSFSVFVINSSHFVEVLANSENGVKVQILTQIENVSRMQQTSNYLASVITFLEVRLGVSFPMTQLSILCLPSFSNYANDFWGVILTGTDASPLDLVFHVLKQWFGHFVTAKNKDDEYITRSLAAYYAYSCSMDREQECVSESQLAFSPHTDFIALQDVKERMTFQEFKDHKMVLFLRMLNFSLSESSFQRGVQVFLKYRSYSTFVEEDLWDAVDIQAWSDGKLDRTISTKDISAAWLSQDMLPLVTIHSDYGNETIVIEQQPFARHWPFRQRNQENVVWQIPISFITENDLKEGKAGDLIWVRDKEMVIQKNPNNFGAYFIANYNNAGMYIVSYDTWNWQALSENLLLEGLSEQFSIPSETRAGILRNAWYLATTGNLQFTSALNATCFMKYEEDFSVWKSFVEVYFMVSWKLLGTGVEMKFEKFVGNLIVPLYENYKDAPNVPKEVNAFAYYILCKAGYEPAIKRARKEFAKWLDNHHEINHGVVGGVVRWVDEDWETGLQHVLDLVKGGKSLKSRSFLLSHLAGNPNEKKVERLLHLVLIDPVYVFSKAEIMNVSPAVFNCETYLKFLSSHWKQVRDRYASEPNMWEYIFEQATKKCKTPEGLKMIEKFYKMHQNDLGTSVNAFKHHIEIARRGIEVIYYQIPEFEEVLDEYIQQS